MTFEGSTFDPVPMAIRKRNYTGKGHRRQTELYVKETSGGGQPFNRREFIAFDGEGLQIDEPAQYSFGTGESAFASNIERVMGPKGRYRTYSDPFTLEYTPEPQPYVLLANSKGMRIINEEGLSTVECFEYLLECKVRYPDSIFVGFSINYDINQMLKDLPLGKLYKLHATNRVHVGQYYLEWYPRKWLYLKHGASGRSVMLYDVFGFFQGSFISAAESYLGKDDPGLVLIREGKEARKAFKWDELDFIMEYNDMELDMLVRMMDILRDDFHKVGVQPGRWHGPGAVASTLFAREGVTLPTDLDKEILDASQYAYAGGRFEQFQLGRHAGTVYEYDIRSAYPSAATLLPNLSKGSWEHTYEFEPGGFGVWAVDYFPDYDHEDNGPQPLYCRAEDGRISYPNQVSGWYWTPEASLVPDYVQEGWVFRESTTERPFRFLESMYEERRTASSPGLKRALKLILNSVYGKLAQTIGGKEGPPKWHCLPYAGFITSYTRAKIYEAAMQKPHAVIAMETDAVFMTEPIDLPLSTALGDWECIELDEIIYLQSGFYYAKTKDGLVCKYRGMDKDVETGCPINLPYDTVMEHLSNLRWSMKPLHSSTTRFVGLGLAKQTNSVWRSWETKDRGIRINDPRHLNKRYHDFNECPACYEETLLSEHMHPMFIGGYSGPSYARVVPWRWMEDAVEMSLEEVLEMKSDIVTYEQEVEAWQ